MQSTMKNNEKQRVVKKWEKNTDQFYWMVKKERDKEGRGIKGKRGRRRQMK